MIAVLTLNVREIIIYFAISAKRMTKLCEYQWYVLPALRPTTRRELHEIVKINAYRNKFTYKKWGNHVRTVRAVKYKRFTVFHLITWLIDWLIDWLCHFPVITILSCQEAVVCCCFKFCGRTWQCCFFVVESFLSIIYCCCYAILMYDATKLVYRVMWVIQWQRQ